jgi:hypothetical protein
MIFDVFMMNDELDVLEMRLTELQDVDKLRHVLIEAPVDHQGHAKPLYYAENRNRFAAWNKRITHVIADGLPSVSQDPNPWSREHGQREYARQGLYEALPGDIVLHGDLDEIPRAEAAQYDPGSSVIGMAMRDHAFAIDWLAQEPFRGTVMTRVRNVKSFTALRYARNNVPLLPDAGWHMNCLGGPEAIRKKLRSFCHLEMKDLLEQGIDGGFFYERGLRWGPPPELKLGGEQLKAVDVDKSWPRYILEGKAPASWYRPRGEGESRI